MAEFLSIGHEDSGAHLVLAHGAGAPMTSPFMNAISDSLAARGVRVHRFEFDYMAQRRHGGSRRPPPRAELLAGEYKSALSNVTRTERPKALYIGGKSLGGRMASLIADELYASSVIAGLVCLGYPFHPPGKPEALRTAHLKNLQCPALIVQGSRDPFGTAVEARQYVLSKAVTFEWIEGGNHDLAPPARSGVAQHDALGKASEAICRFVRVRG